MFVVVKKSTSKKDCHDRAWLGPDVASVAGDRLYTWNARIEERLYWRLWRRANAVSQISNFGAEIGCREFLNGWVAATQCGAMRVGLWSWIIHEKSGKSRTVELVSEIFNYPFRAVHTITLTSFICNVPRGIVAQNLRDKKKRWIWSIGHSFYFTLALLSLNISSSPRMPMPNPVMTTRATTPYRLQPRSC